MTQYGFFIDLSRCIGCNACTIACKQWHNLEPGPVKWMRVYQWEKGSFPDIDVHVLPIPCFHCAKPVCAEACPNKAITKNEKYGAVLVDSSKCTGLRKCWEACPYGSPQFEGDAPGLKMSKCNMCIDRLEQGIAPICVLSCSMRALEFGPIDSLRKKYSNIADGVSEGFSQCRVSCPAKLAAGAYIKLIAEGKPEEALAFFNTNSPFAGVLGRICTHPCEVDCLRGQFDESIPICSLKRYMADKEFNEGRKKATKLNLAHAEKIAVIGSGPAGLSCAYDLIRQGYPVTVFEAESKSGGLLRYGIPDYRLPRDILDDEIGLISELGVEIKTDNRIDSVGSLFQQGYKAVFVAIGAWHNLKLNVPGEDSPGLHYALDFLKKINSGKKVRLGKKVIVIGGGSVAIDAARVAKRQGATEVHIICLESCDFTVKDRMLAQPEEVDEAANEGVKIHPCLGIKSVVIKNKKVAGLETMTCLSVRDADGKFAPTFDKTCTTTIKADNIIVAIGQSVDPLSGLTGLKRGPSNRLEVDPVTLETGYRGVFAGGDVVGGPGNVIGAIAAGKAAAVSIDRYINGEDMKKDREPLISRRPVSTPLRYVASKSVTRRGEQAAIEQAKLCLNCDITVPSVVFKSVDPKKQVVPWDSVKALELWQKRNPNDGAVLPDVFSDASEVTRDSSDITGRNELMLKPVTREKLMHYTTDDE